MAKNSFKMAKTKKTTDDDVKIGKFLKRGTRNKFKKSGAL